MKYTIPIALTLLLGSCTEGTQAGGSEKERLLYKLKRVEQ